MYIYIYIEREIYIYRYIYRYICLYLETFDFSLCEEPLGGLFCPRGLDMAVLRLSPLLFLSWCKEHLGLISCLYHNLHDCCANGPD